MSIKLSFVIPVYNVGHYLDECLKSILCQMSPEVEIILVDDGSTDDSGEICDRYADANQNVFVLHQQNKGLAAARNAGIGMIHGEYVAFVDSDDYIADRSIKKILAYIEEGGCDICFMRANKFFSDGTVEELGDQIDRTYIHGKEKKEVWQYLSTRPKYPGSTCTKIIRSAFIKEKNIQFPIERLHAEDLPTTMHMLLEAETYDALDIPYYYYRQNRGGSLTSKVNIDTFMDLASFVREYATKLTRHDVRYGKDIARCAMSFVAYEYTILMWQYKQMIVAEQKKRAKKFLNEYKWVLSYAACLKVVLVRKLAAVLGINATSWMMSVYVEIKKKF